jgi:mevalonate kinase
VNNLQTFSQKIQETEDREFVAVANQNIMTMLELQQLMPTLQELLVELGAVSTATA